MMKVYYGKNIEIEQIVFTEMIKSLFAFLISRAIVYNCGHGKQN